MRRLGVGIAAALLVVGLGLLIVRTGVATPGGAMSGEEAAAAAAVVLGIDRAAMHEQGPAGRTGDGATAQEFTVGGERVRVSAGPRFGLRVQWTDRLNGARSRAPGVDLATARSAAQAVVKRRFANVADMRLTMDKRLPTGVYMFVWSDVRIGGVLTGDSARVMVAPATGQPVLYGESRRSRPEETPQPQVSREDADKAARGILARRMGAGHPVRLDQGGLVLSSPLSPTRGPVWQMEYIDESLSPDEGRIAAQFVVIDAVTGSDLTQALSGKSVPAEGAK